MTLAQFDVYSIISGEALTQAGDGGLVQVNGGIELVQLSRIGKSGSGADCLAAIALNYSPQIIFYILPINW